MLDRERLHVRTDQLHLIGRMHGGGWYTKTDDLFEIPRVTFEEWQLKADER